MNTLKSSLLKKGKKGFTLTELAIVIAVIAILIAVLVPTFTSVINSARRTTAAETASHALTEYTIETSSSVPDGSVVINGDYCWTIKNGSFEVSEDSKSEDANKDDKVLYSWGKDADAGIKEIKLYIPTTDIDESIAKVVAKNIVVSYTLETISYIGVAYSDPNASAAAGSKFALAAAVLTADEGGEGGETGSDDTTYYYFEVKDGVVSSYDGTPTTTGLETDKTSYSGVVIYYTGSDDSSSQT